MDELACGAATVSRLYCRPASSLSIQHQLHRCNASPLQGKAGQGGGLFLSPYGVAQALGMLLNGVEPGGESFRQLQVSKEALQGHLQGPLHRQLQGLLVDCGDRQPAAPAVCMLGAALPAPMSVR